MNTIKECQHCGFHLQLPIDDFEHAQKPTSVCDQDTFRAFIENTIVLICPKCRHGNY
jgi:hypothetical protein